jgi:lipid-binding SYLF domain-containing protein
MKCSSNAVQVICLGLLTFICTTGSAQFKEDRIMQESVNVLNEIMKIPANGIPRNMLNDAQAVAIIPGVIKGSFVVGARHGNGVVMIRDEKGGWHAPIFITLTGGNVGWQVGVQSTDVVLVFKTKKSVQGLLSGRIALGADAAVAAGPIGRQGAAATDSALGAQIYSYSRSRGLFAGVSIDGSVIRTNTMSNANYYRAATPGGPVVIPASAQQLGNEVIKYAGKNIVANARPLTKPVPAIQASAQTNSKILAQQHSMLEVDHLRDQLAKIAPEMYKLLDPNWQRYLGIPVEVFQGTGHPSAEAINECLKHFEVVRSDRRFSELAGHPEFQSTYGLLKHYVHELSDNKKTINLPAPPVVNR